MREEFVLPARLACPEASCGMSLLLELSVGLLLLGSATTGLLLCFRGCPRRAIRLQARRWSRNAWQDGDAHLVLGATLLYLAGLILPRLDGSIQPSETPPDPGSLLVSAAVLPLFTLMLCHFRASVSGKRLSELLGIRKATWKRDVRIGLLGGLALLAPSLALSWASAQVLTQVHLPPEVQESLRWFRDPSTSSALRILVVMQAVLAAPLIEEILYRGVILSVVLRHLRPVSAVLLVSVFFAVLHLQTHVTLSLFLVGAVFSLGVLVTGSMVTPILMHVVFNASNLWIAWAGM